MHFCSAKLLAAASPQSVKSSLLELLGNEPPNHSPFAQLSRGRVQLSSTSNCLERCRRLLIRCTSSLILREGTVEENGCIFYKARGGSQAHLSKSYVSYFVWFWKYHKWKFWYKFPEKFVKQGKGSKAVFRKFIQSGRGGRPLSHSGETETGSCRDKAVELVCMQSSS